MSFVLHARTQPSSSSLGKTVYTGRIIEAGGEMGSVGFGFSGQQLANKGSFMTVANSVLSLDSDDQFIEFRSSHRKKKSFGDAFGIPVGDKPVGTGGSSLFLTYGKMHPYKVKLLTGNAARENIVGGLDSGFQLGETVIAVISSAAGPTALSAAALSGITLGAGVGVAIVAVSATAINNHIKNLKSNQVFLRVSKTLKGSQLKGFFPYEEKIYQTEMVTGNLTYRGIRQKLAAWV